MGRGVCGLAVCRVDGGDNFGLVLDFWLAKFWEFQILAVAVVLLGRDRPGTLLLGLGGRPCVEL